MSLEVKQTEPKYLQLDKSINNLKYAITKLNYFIEGLFNLDNPKAPNEKDEKPPSSFAQVLEESPNKINKAAEEIDVAIERLRDILF